MSPLALGIDIGGTNTAFGLVDALGHVHYSNNFKTADFSSAESLAKKVLKDVSSQVTSMSNIEGIGIGAPNGNYHNGTIEFAPNLQWKGVIPLAAIFKKHFNLPVTVTNDANAAAVGEMLFGAAQGMRDFLLVTLGTGLGSGFVCKGEVLYGHTGMAGELGHIIVQPGGRACGCGRKGCLETYASATGFKRTIAELRQTFKVHSPLVKTPMTRISAKRTTELAEQGDPMALKAFDITARYLAHGLATAVAITSPEAVILAGGLTRSGKTLTDPLEKYFNQELLVIFQHKVPVLVSKLLDENAAVLGAAALVLQR
ncbi:MAG: ROK family protein [Cryomorphaceae bacterium]|nr:MAG: ROK family protein [Cryomorphaceae bacterium]